MNKYKINYIDIVKGDPLEKVWENLLGSPANYISTAICKYWEL